MGRRKPNDERRPKRKVELPSRSVRDLRHREPQKKRGKAPAVPAVAPRAKPRTVAHPLYGAIPLIQRTGTDGAGRPYEVTDYDPDYAPPLPRGAMRGDVRRQEFCRMCHTPKYFYLAEEKTCLQCGERFVFGAGEQKHWYETLKFHFDSVAVRCARCRKQRRSQRALEAELAQARAAVRAEPKSPASLVSLAEAIARLFERSGRGNLAHGIAASRAARREARVAHHRAEAAEAIFWEATCQRLSGHEAKARVLYEEYLATAYHGRNHEALVRWLLRHGVSERREKSDTMRRS